MFDVLFVGVLLFVFFLFLLGLQLLKWKLNYTFVFKIW